ncbi:MAG: hypothetical protein JOZ54_00055 [Acidobacteria bacterium]|nr:hypothetical protein [Acidobacteriota bacterium]
MSGTFAVVGAFAIAGHGLALYGDVLTGNARNGELVMRPDGTPLPIRSVEMMDLRAERKAHAALVFRFEDVTLEELRALDGTTVPIQPAE